MIKKSRIYKNKNPLGGDNSANKKATKNEEMWFGVITGLTCHLLGCFWSGHLK